MTSALPAPPLEPAQPDGPAQPHGLAQPHGPVQPHEAVQPFAWPPPAAEPIPVPGPPQGPGVFPPFPAPPVEGKGLRVGLGLGIGAAVLVLVCGGGVAAVIGLFASMTSALDEQAHVVVGDYFEALEAKKFDEAYGMLCQDVKDQQSQAEFISAEEAAEPIQAHTVGDLRLTVDATVPVAVTYTDGQTGTLQVYLQQSPDTGQFQVCGVEE